MKSNRAYTITDSEVFIPELTFYGRYHKSRNGSYLIARGESIEDRCERIVLFENEEMLVNKQLANVRHAYVSDTGHFLLDTWTDSGGGSSQVLAMDRAGSVIAGHTVRSSVVSLGLSDDGCFAAIQTGFGEYIHDSAMLIFLDIENNEILWKTRLTDWTTDYTFDLDEKLLRLSLKKGEPLVYGFDGSLQLRETLSEGG